MKVVVAIDSFKGSMSSLEAGLWVKKGIKRADKKACVKVIPIADGGEGTVQALTKGLDGSYRKVEVSNPLGNKRIATYGVVGNTAIIESAEAVGITLISKNQLNPLYTTSYGIGEMILDALKFGCRKFLIGIGGSSTNDGGVGMLSALGFRFLDKQKNPIKSGALGLKDLCYIDDKNANVLLKDCEFNVACDVSNPLCGQLGCSNVFSRQKGAKEQDVSLMDCWLQSYATLTNKLYSDSDQDFPGSGAAGGLGFAFKSYLKANLKSGIDLVLDLVGIEESIKNCDIVVTGEGKIDEQTIMGKAPIGVAKIGKKYGKKVVAFCGSASDKANVCNQYGIDGVFPIIRSVCTLEEAMNKKTAKNNIANTAEQVFNLIKKVNAN